MSDESRPERMHGEALVLLMGLVESEISSIDKSMMCLNLALEWLDKGIEFERPYARAFVAVHKAGSPATQGYIEESRALYRELLGLPFLTESDKETVRRNLETLS